MTSSSPVLLLVTEVHNFGGFFGGDTVTLSGRPWADAAGAEQTLTIDQAALANVHERHHIAAGMLLELHMAGERVDRAVLLGARDHGALRTALGPAAPQGPLAGPLLLSYRCAHCGLWLASAPDQEGPRDRCALCGTPLG